MTNLDLQKLFNYDPKSGEIRWKSTNTISGYVDNRGFRVIYIKRKAYRAHIIAWELFHGKKGKEIYHVNGNKDDNRIDNLREFDIPDNFSNVFGYNPETGDIFWKISPSRKVKSGDKAGCVCKTNKFIVILYNKKQYKAHRLAWELYHGYPSKYEIDHINGNPADNRIENLRDVPHDENQKNMKVSKNSKTGITGVRRTKSGRWQVTIQSKWIGTYDDFENAVQIRQIMEDIEGFHPNHGKR